MIDTYFAIVSCAKWTRRLRSRTSVENWTSLFLTPRLTTLSITSSTLLLLKRQTLQQEIKQLLTLIGGWILSSPSIQSDLPSLKILSSSRMSILVKRQRDRRFWLRYSLTIACVNTMQTHWLRMRKPRSLFSTPTNKILFTSIISEHSYLSSQSRKIKARSTFIMVKAKWTLTISPSSIASTCLTLDECCLRKKGLIRLTKTQELGELANAKTQGQL